jgi:vancomycin permeability regulator SanA
MKYIPQSTINSITILNKLKRLKTFLKYISIVICVSVFVYIIFTVFNIYSFGSVNELTFADAAVILGAGVWDDKPSPVFQERINHGIWLYKNNYVKYLIFTGGVSKNSNVSEASAAMKYYELFFYIIYKIYKNSFIIILYLILFEFILIIYHYSIFCKSVDQVQR